MKEEEKRLIKMLQDVFATEEDEIQCDAASIQMIQSAEAQLSDEASQKRFPELWRHFRVCSDCRREYRMLNDMIHLEETGQLELDVGIHEANGDLRDLFGSILIDDEQFVSDHLLQGHTK